MFIPLLTALLFLFPAASAAPAPAEDPLAACAAELAADPASREASGCLYRAARVSGAYDDAIARVQEVRRAHPAAPWPAMTETNLHVDQGRRGYETAVAELEEIATAFDAASDTPGAVFARLNRSQYLLELGRDDEAIAAVAAASRIAEEAGDENLAVTARVQHARLLWRLDRQLEEAYRLLRDLEPRLFPDGEHQARVVALKVLASLTQRTGRFDESIAALQRLEEIALEAGDRYVLGTVLHDQLRLAQQLPERTDALHGGDLVAFAERVRDEAMDSGNQWAAAAADCLAAQVLGNGDAGIAAQRACIARADRDEADLATRMQARIVLAESLHPTDPEEAWALLDEADALAAREEPSGTTVRLAIARADLAAVEGNLDGVREAGQAALDDIEALAGAGVGNPSDLALNLWWLSQAYYSIADHLRDEAPEQSLQVIERYRAQALLRRLLDQRAFRASDEERRQLTQVEGMLDDARDRLWEASDEESRTGALQEVASLRARIGRLRESIRARDDRTGIVQTPTPTLSELQATLAADEALLTYQLPPEVGARHTWPEAWAWVITREDLTAVDVPHATDLREPIALFAGLFQRRDGSEAVPAVGLYRQVLEPAVEVLPDGIERLVIVPDGPLHRLPFGALRAEGDAPPIDARFVVSRVPSATLWHRWRNEPDPAWRRAAVVMGDPAFDPELADGLERLPAASAEAQSVLEHVGNASLALDAAASEPWLRALVDDTVGIVHIAAHAVVDEVYPERSAVLLAPAAGEDGRLEIHEIVSLQLDAPLVVLSSCRGASGRLLGGEGPMALSRAFFQGGAQTVIASLWPLRDEDAAALFGPFYEGIARGQDAGAALAAAKRARIDAGAPAEAWAGVVLLGEGNHVPLPGGQPTISTRLPVVLLGVGVLGLVSFLGLGWWWTRRR